MNVNDLRKLEASIEAGFHYAHQAGSLAYRISEVYLSDGKRIESAPLVMKFKRAVADAELESSLLPSRIAYAERLAASPALLYEEMHKLLNLSQEVLALQSFGYIARCQNVEQYVTNVSVKLRAERTVALLVCEDQGLDPSHSFWERSGIAHPEADLPRV